jgi:hypothetical protein
MEEVNTLSVIFLHRESIPADYALHYIKKYNLSDYVRELCTLAAKKEYPKGKCGLDFFKFYEAWVANCRRIADENALTAKINDKIDKMKEAHYNSRKN